MATGQAQFGWSGAIPFPPLSQVEFLGDLQVLHKGALLWRTRRPVLLSANKQPTN
jgi:hypothetical protein